MAPSSPPAEKPLLRGVSHQVGFFVAVIATVLLVRAARSPEAARAAAVFGGSLALLLGVSALYHRVHWSPRGRALMRRADHSAIFVLIAGGYTPLLTLVPPAGGGGGRGALALVWGGALVGIAKSLLWSGAPKWVTATLALAVGWMVVGPVIDRAPSLDAISVACIVAGGVLYSSGAIVYALKRPDPWPRVFGYHEVFHALVLLASGILFVHVARIVTP